MNTLLHIQTALDEAFVALSENGQVFAERRCASRNDHASFLHPAIESMLQEHGLKIAAIHAISLVNGPGSYTGLRVGMACAKGLCYALSIPLITISTLDWMAEAAEKKQGLLYCPMIDARRMEVFTALYDYQGKRLMEPHARILTPESFQEELNKQQIIFFGNGSDKWKTLSVHENSHFANIHFSSAAAANMAWSAYQASSFSDLKSSLPFYGKEFYSTIQN